VHLNVLLTAAALRIPAQALRWTTFPFLNLQHAGLFLHHWNFQAPGVDFGHPTIAGRPSQGNDLQCLATELIAQKLVHQIKRHLPYLDGLQVHDHCHFCEVADYPEGMTLAAPGMPLSSWQRTK
jgi:hypothetical protein